MEEFNNNLKKPKNVRFSMSNDRMSSIIGHDLFKHWCSCIKVLKFTRVLMFYCQECTSLTKSVSKKLAKTIYFTIKT